METHLPYEREEGATVVIERGVHVLLDFFLLLLPLFRAPRVLES